MTCHDCVLCVLFCTSISCCSGFHLAEMDTKFNTIQIFDQRKLMEADWVWFWTGPLNRWFCLFLHEIFGTGQPAEPERGLHTRTSSWTTLEKSRRSLDMFGSSTGHNWAGHGPKHRIPQNDLVILVTSSPVSEDIVFLRASPLIAVSWQKTVRRSAQWSLYCKPAISTRMPALQNYFAWHSSTVSSCPRHSSPEMPHALYSLAHLSTLRISWHPWLHLHFSSQPVLGCPHLDEWDRMRMPSDMFIIFWRTN